jgi:two-component system, OmpR family, KDP operon response regulator KdpE
MTDERSIVQCLDAGADDYITKPFRSNELLARVRAALRRRPQRATAEQLEVGPLTIGLGDRRVFRHGQEVRLTPTEYRLLLPLAREPNKVFTHKMLLTTVWGPEYADEPHVLRVTMNRLRAKLGDPPLIENRPAVGYLLVTGNGEPLEVGNRARPEHAEGEQGTEPALSSPKGNSATDMVG